MIKVSVLYPNNEGCRFDMEYYCRNHMPLVQRLLGPALRGVAVEQGICGESAEARPAYVAMGHLFFESVETYEVAFRKHGTPIVEDIPNYTNVKPTIQISEVKL